MKVSIDEAVCIGCGLCASTCEECFQMNGNVAKAVKKECDNPDIEEIADNCPVGAIKLEK